MERYDANHPFSSVYGEPTIVAKFKDASHILTFRMKSKRVTVAYRKPDGSIGLEDIHEFSFRGYLAAFYRGLGESRSS